MKILPGLPKSSGRGSRRAVSPTIRRRAAAAQAVAACEEENDEGPLPSKRFMRLPSDSIRGSSRNADKNHVACACQGVSKLGDHPPRSLPSNTPGRLPDITLPIITYRRLGIDCNDQESTSANPCDWLYRPSLSRVGREVPGAIESPCIDRSRIALLGF